MDEGHISLLTRDGIGSMPEEPIMVITSGPFLTCNKKVLVVGSRHDYAYSGILPVTMGEILYTDGITKEGSSKGPYHKIYNWVSYFDAKNESGSMGAVPIDIVKFC